MAGTSRTSRRIQTPQLCAPNSSNVYSYSSPYQSKLSIDLCDCIVVDTTALSTECVAQTILPPAKTRKIRVVQEPVKLEDYMLSNLDRNNKMDIFDAQVQSIRNMVFGEFGLIGENGECDETALEMCEGLQQLEQIWRQSLAGSEEQREAAPILVEFASATAAAEESGGYKLSNV